MPWAVAAVSRLAKRPRGGLALTRRSRPRRSSSEEDARRLHPFRSEAGMPDVALPEKRKVDSSILSLTTRFGPVSGALTRVNADSALQCLQPSSDHDCPCVTVVGRSLSHVDRTPCLRALGSLSTRRRLFGSKPTRTLQGMARVRSGQASAWPLSSGRSVRRGSRIKRDFACTFTRPFTCARCPAVTVTLEAGGADTYTQGAISGNELGQGLSQLSSVALQRQQSHQRLRLVWRRARKQDCLSLAVDMFKYPREDASGASRPSSFTCPRRSGRMGLQ
jgi:hypothetical protein